MLLPRPSEALARLTEHKDDEIRTLVNEVTRLRKVQEEVLSCLGQNPTLARQLLFYESLKLRELPSPTFTWRGQDDVPTSWVVHDAGLNVEPSPPKQKRRGRTNVAAEMSPRQAKVAEDSTSASALASASVSAPLAFYVGRGVGSPILPRGRICQRPPTR